MYNNYQKIKNNELLEFNEYVQFVIDFNRTYYNYKKYFYKLSKIIQYKEELKINVVDKYTLFRFLTIISDTSFKGKNKVNNDCLNLIGEVLNKKNIKLNTLKVVNNYYNHLVVDVSNTFLYVFKTEELRDFISLFDKDICEYVKELIKYNRITDTKLFYKTSGNILSLKKVMEWEYSKIIYVLLEKELLKRTIKENENSTEKRQFKIWN